jgi:preprotein translocase SecF subunit
MPLRLVPDNTRIPFMRLARIRTPISLVLIVLSFVLLFTVGLNQGIDFIGGTVIEVRSKAPQADLADIREKVGALELGDVEVQGIGQPTDVLIRVATQPGGDAAQQAVVQKVQAALGNTEYEYRRVEVVGPRVSGELAWTGTMATLFTIVGIMIYIWFRFEWQFALGAVATLVHDAILTVGFFAATQHDFNLSSIAAILTILGYSLNDTVVIFDRIRELLRRYKTMPLGDLIDLATNQTLARTLMTAGSVLLALLALYFFGGEVIRSFTAAMIWGVFIATASSIFIGGPILIYFNLRPRVEPAAAAKPNPNEANPTTPAKA